MKVEENKQDQEFGPWFQHAGASDPVPFGTVVEVVRADGTKQVFARGTIQNPSRSSAENAYRRTKRLAGLVVTKNGKVMSSSWLWRGYGPKFSDIVEYRIKKPRGMVVLEEVLNNLPTPKKRKQKEYME